MKIYVRANDDEVEAYRKKKIQQFIDIVKNGHKDPYWIADTYFDLQDTFKYDYGVIFDQGEIYPHLNEEQQVAIENYWEDNRGDLEFDDDSDGDGWFDYMEP